MMTNNQKIALQVAILREVIGISVNNQDVVDVLHKAPVSDAKAKRLLETANSLLCTRTALGLNEFVHKDEREVYVRVDGDMIRISVKTHEYQLQATADTVNYRLSGNAARSEAEHDMVERVTAALQSVFGAFDASGMYLHPALAQQAI